jgi:hypothetical protein
LVIEEYYPLISNFSLPRIIGAMPPVVSHLYTYFLFPFSIDKQTILAGHREIWAGHSNWMEGLDEWIAAHPGPGSSPMVDRLGRWRRALYTRFDMDSPVYQDGVSTVVGASF